MWENCDVIVIFPIKGQFKAIWKPGSKCIVGKTYIVSLAKWLSVRLRAKWLWVRVPLQSFNLTKTENRTKKSLTPLSRYCLE